MKIDLKAIPESGASLQGMVDVSIVDVRDPGLVLKSPIRYNLRVQVVGKMLLVRGKLSCPASFYCSRCLEQLSQVVEVPDFNTQEAIKDPAGVIDLTERVREDIILALPYKPLCSPHCRGLCPVCGANLNEQVCNCSKGDKNYLSSQFQELDINRVIHGRSQKKDK